jgi:hypothetical protein
MITHVTKVLNKPAVWDLVPSSSFENISERTQRTE